MKNSPRLKKNMNEGFAAMTDPSLLTEPEDVVSGRREEGRTGGLRGLGGGPVGNFE
jgi:hypothetical protein